MKGWQGLGAGAFQVLGSWEGVQLLQMCSLGQHCAPRAGLRCRACLPPTCICPHPLTIVPPSCLVRRPYTPAVPSPASQDAANN